MHAFDDYQGYTFNKLCWTSTNLNMYIDYILYYICVYMYILYMHME